MSTAGSDFDKYRRKGAYHWIQTNASWRNGDYNPPTAARFDVIDRVLPAKACSILDVGCGDGYLLYRLENRYPSAALYGVDADETGARLARDRLQESNTDAQIAVDSAYDLSYEEGIFDLVLLTEVIEHLEAPGRALEEIRRVMKKEGTLLVTTPNRQHDFIWDPEYHVHEYSAVELKSKLQEHFLEVHVSACWPMRWMRWWRSGSTARQLIRAYSRLFYNPLLETSSLPAPSYGMLVARCVAPA